MYIVNPFSVKKYEVKNKIIAKYLIKKNIPLLSKDSSGFYFAQTNELNNTLGSLPWYLKVLL